MSSQHPRYEYLARSHSFTALAVGLALLVVGATSDTVEAQTGSISVHDPDMIKHDGRYYVYSTHGGIQIRRSENMTEWRRIGSVFENRVPDWAREEIDGVRGVWAPDIKHFNGRFHIYYTLSTFGSNRSAIGLATNTTLDPDNPEYEWVDRGKVFESFRGDNYNAIDANVVFDADGRLWMSFGSYWDGIMMIELDPETGKPLKEDPEVIHLAARPEQDAIEAPYIVYNEPYYYLFVSYDRCCRGVNSTYRIMVGRSEDITGPYVDASGDPMLEGHAMELLAGDGSRHAAMGHNAVFQDDDGQWYLVYHFYDAEANGRSRLQIRPMAFDDDGWPTLDPPLSTPEGEPFPE